MDPADRDIGAYLHGVDQALNARAERLAPSDELQSRLSEQVPPGITALCERFIDNDGQMRWRAGLETERGNLYEPIDEDPEFDDDPDELWIAAFHELGVEL